MSVENIGTLESLCLDLIIKNFKLFHSSLSVSTDDSLHKNFEFLKRKFSYELALKLFSDNEVTDEYFDILINKHLTVVHFKWFKRSHYLECIDDIFCRLPNLQVLTMSEVGDEVLRSVSKFCPRLSQIDAQYSSITDKGIGYFCKQKNGIVPCPELKSIDMKRSSLTERGIMSLIQSLPLLKKFTCRNLPFVLHSLYKKCSFEPHEVVEYFNFTELEFVDRPTIEEVDDVYAAPARSETYYPAKVIKSSLIMCPNMKSITCVFSKKEQLDALANSRLKKLEIAFSKKPMISIDDFLKSSGYNLQILRITNCTVSASSLANHCPLLNDLIIYQADFLDDDLYSTFPCLTKILLSMKEPVRAFHLLTSSPNLESVTFSTCKFSDELKNEILTWNCSTLKEVTFNNINDIPFDFFRDFLSHCHSLKQLVISDCTYKYLNRYFTQTLNAFTKNLPNKPKVIFK